MATRVKPDVLRRYGTIRMRRGLAVVAVSNGTCLGCHMNIPPQLYNQLQRADAILTCPQCHRIIYWDQLMVEEDPGEGSEESSDGDGGEGGVEQAGC
jgi:predicted  nucleic acid-binding Zn-ribbon protein